MLQWREDRFRATSESTNQRVLWWAIAQTLLLVTVGFWQMRHLRGFFEAKKLVWHCRMFVVHVGIVFLLKVQWCTLSGQVSIIYVSFVCSVIKVFRGWYSRTVCYDFLLIFSVLLTISCSCLYVGSVNRHFIWCYCQQKCSSFVCFDYQYNVLNFARAAPPQSVVCSQSLFHF